MAASSNGLCFKIVNVHAQTVSLASPVRTALQGWSVGNQYSKSPWCFEFSHDCVMEEYGEVTIHLAPGSPQLANNANVVESSTDIFWRDTETNELMQQHVLNERDNLVLRDADGKVQIRYDLAKV